MNINFASNLKFHRERLNLSKTELGKRVGVSDTAIGMWENGKTSPRMGKIQMIADVLGISTDELVFNQTQNTNKVALKVVNEPTVAYRTTSPVIIEDKDESPTGWICSYPVYGSISAGIPLEMVDLIEHVEIPSFIYEKYPEAFFLKVNGDSMNKIIHDGMYALINPCEEGLNGEVYAVAINGYEATLKRFFKLNNSIVLEPDSYNEEHKSQLFNQDEIESVKIIGKLVWVMAPYNYKF